MKKFPLGWFLIGIAVGLALCKHGHAAGHDTVAIQIVNAPSEMFTGCSVVKDEQSYFAVNCDKAQENNTFFLGVATKQESVIVLLPNSFRFYPDVCFLVGENKYKGGTVYIIECLGGG